MGDGTGPSWRGHRRWPRCACERAAQPEGRSRLKEVATAAPASPTQPSHLRQALANQGSGQWASEAEDVLRAAAWSGP